MHQAGRTAARERLSGWCWNLFLQFHTSSVANNEYVLFNQVKFSSQVKKKKRKKKKVLQQYCSCSSYGKTVAKVLHVISVKTKRKS